MKGAWNAKITPDGIVCAAEERGAGEFKRQPDGAWLFRANKKAAWEPVSTVPVAALQGAQMMLNHHPTGKDELFKPVPD